MINRRLLILSVLALLGYGGLFLLYPKTSPAARWDFRLDRPAAIEKVKAAAASYGFAAAKASENLAVDYQRADEYYLSRQPNPLFGSLFTPLAAQVRLADAKSGAEFEAWLNSRGELLGYRIRERPSSSKPAESKSEKSPAPPGEASAQVENAEALVGDQKLADEALRRFLGDRYGKFSFLSGSAEGKDGKKYSWTASDEGLRVLAEVVIRRGKVGEIWVQFTLTPKFQSEYRGLRSGMIEALSSAENLLVWPAIVLMIILYFVSLARRQIDHRKTLTFFAVCFVLLLAASSSGGVATEILHEIRVNNAPLSLSVGTLLLWATAVFINLIVAACLYLFFAPGLTYSAQSPNRRTVDLELLLQGKLLRRPVTGSLIAGFLAGGVLAVIAHAIAALGLFHGAMIDAGGLEDIFLTKNPAANTFFSGSQFVIFMIFAFLIPVTEAVMKNRLGARILSFLFAFMTMVGLESFRISAPALAMAGLLQAYLLVWLYRNFGLLAVMITTIAAHVTDCSAALMAQPTPSLQASGRHALIILGAAFVAALVGFWRSREAREEEVAVKTPVENRAERDRLHGEFTVARKAQQHMLPDAPPPVPGVNISAVCHPSKDVGGDLYDFLPLPEGKVGVVVADVSGKGVPASLYMTLTKGLLDSVTENKSDPGEILREVNRHLYTVCQRKSFVTMFLGVLDPGRKTLSYARAGHNPTVLHRASANKTWMLKSPGMGLGLNNGKIFDQSLKVESIQLERGDKLFFYSDGITEAMNTKRDEYGEDRLMAMAERTNGMDAEQSRDAVMADVAEFLGPVSPQDDQTLVVLQVL
jgi:serine phosphatase RsbU (regulator of sigma subunit)